jgi:hypothetical protein
MVDANGKQTITNDGATVMKVSLLEDYSAWYNFSRPVADCSLSCLIAS